MTLKQAKILGLFCRQVAELAAETLTAFAESEKSSNQVSSASPPSNSEKRFMNREQIAECLGVSVRTVSELIKDGLPTVPLGKRRIQFDCDEVLNWAKDKRLKGDADTGENTDDSGTFVERGKPKLRVVS